MTISQHQVLKDFNPSFLNFCSLNLGTSYCNLKISFITELYLDVG